MEWLIVFVVVSLIWTVWFALRAERGRLEAKACYDRAVASAEEDLRKAVRKAEKRSSEQAQKALAEGEAALRKSRQLADEWEEREADLETRAERADDWERRFWEQHAVVERVLKERDEWQKRFFEQGALHLEGQALLEHKILGLRQQRKQLVDLINSERKEAGDKPLVNPDKLGPLDAEPLGQSEKFLDHLKRLSAEAKQLVADNTPAEDDGS